mgnify:CR=1 FL=1
MILRGSFCDTISRTRYIGTRIAPRGGDDFGASVLVRFFADISKKTIDTAKIAQFKMILRVIFCDLMRRKRCSGTWSSSWRGTDFGTFLLPVFSFCNLMFLRMRNFLYYIENEIHGYAGCFRGRGDSSMRNFL